MGIEAKAPPGIMLRLDGATYDSLDQLAAATGRTRDWLAARAVEDYVALSASELSRVEAGVAAAGRGDFASEAEMSRLREKFAARA